MVKIYIYINKKNQRKASKRSTRKVSKSFSRRKREKTKRPKAYIKSF